ncbi:MAG: hypothetical protein M1147_00190 [Nitrospirae bacterium]|nr:hypothetical protein [Nitrospirota bacterium]MCL5976531.1 hypothetical protein [Nitrospirota bacterium]
MDDLKDNTTELKEALKFLERDFNQCFQQMRYYDSQIFDILKFMFTAYTALIGVALGLYQFGLKEKIYLTIPAITALIIGLILGLFMFYLVLINRSYYVRVARYINEQRSLFLSFKPLGFENASRMYTNVKQPYFSRESTQIWLVYIVGALNATLLGVLLFILSAAYYYRWPIVIGSSLVILSIQIVIVVKYLKSQENKSVKTILNKNNG